MINANEIWMLVCVLAGIVLSLIIYGVGYSKGLDDGSEIKKQDIETLLKKSKEANK